MASLALTTPPPAFPRRRAQRRPPRAVVTPEVARYELLREEWQLEASQRPAAIGIPETAVELSEIAHFAHALGLRTAVYDASRVDALGSLDDAILLAPLTR